MKPLNRLLRDIVILSWINVTLWMFIGFWVGLNYSKTNQETGKNSEAPTVFTNAFKISDLPIKRSPNPETEWQIKKK